MNKKKILIVSSAFHPDISARALRATELAKEFSKQGHDVTVLTTDKDYNYDDFLAIHKTLKIIHTSRTIFPEIDIKGKKFVSILKRGLRRALLLLFEYPNIELMFKVVHALKKEKAYDLLISSAVPYPVHWGVAKSRTTKHPIAKIWVADCGDPYMGCKTDSFRKLFYFKYIEKWFCHKTNYLSIPIAEAKDSYYPEFHNKIVVIPQGFDFSNKRLSTRLHSNQCPTFAFAGSLTPYVDSAPPFLKYLAKTTTQFKFILYLNSAGSFTKYIDDLGDRIEVRPYIPREQLIFELSKMDFLVNFMYKTTVQKSSKLINYALTCRPILNVYAEDNCSINFTEFIKKNYTSQYDVENIQNYNIQNVATQFLELT